MDAAWWRMYIDEVRATFRGERFSSNQFGRTFPVTHLPQPFKAHGNSGAGAVSLAVHGGAQRIVLLGYDCQHTDGRTHWHGDHPPQLGNARVVKKWPDRFRRLARSLDPGICVLNATRETALDCWPRMNLEEALA